MEIPNMNAHFFFFFKLHLIQNITTSIPMNLLMLFNQSSNVHNTHVIDGSNCINT